MQNHKEEWINLHVRLGEKLYNKMHNASFIHKISKAEIVRVALEKYLQELKIA